MPNTQIIESIYQKILEYRRIFLFRHTRIDGDCTGATKGLKAIIRATWPEKDVYIIDDELSDFLAFMGQDDAPVDEELYKDALGIVIDTANADRISNPRFQLCRELIKIDHHIERDPFCHINWVEEERSSACEMIAYFYSRNSDRLRLTHQAAQYLYTGMVTDSGRFKYEGVNGETMRLAGMLLDQGIDLEMLYAHLYLKDVSSLRFRAYVYSNMQITENGVAYIHVPLAVQKEFNLSFEAACTSISYLEGIAGCLCWLAFIETGSDIRVRLRSRFVSINTVAEHFSGGGHACASGATVYSQEEMLALIAEADAASKEYKETHEGWL